MSSTMGFDKKETWVIINNYEDYQISNFGRVKSLKFGREKILKLSPTGDGYCVVNLSKNGKIKRFKIHRLVGLHFIDNYKMFDHTDRNGLNNNINNLRLCNKSTNAANSKKRKNTSSQYKGVYWDGFRKKWVASIKVNYKKIYLGRYEDENQAAFAYNNAAKKYFGDFANVNRI